MHTHIHTRIVAWKTFNLLHFVPDDNLVVLVELVVLVVGSIDSTGSIVTTNYK